jgi:hypothetical protein
MEAGGLTISLKDGTTQSALSTYVASVKFMAQWLEGQDGAGGKSTKELLEEFEGNVCAMMKGEYKGTG